MIQLKGVRPTSHVTLKTIFKTIQFLQLRAQKRQNVVVNDGTCNEQFKNKNGCSSTLAIHVQ